VRGRVPRPVNGSASMPLANPFAALYAGRVRSAARSGEVEDETSGSSIVHPGTLSGVARPRRKRGLCRRRRKSASSPLSGSGDKNAFTCERLKALCLRGVRGYEREVELCASMRRPRMAEALPGRFNRRRLRLARRRASSRRFSRRVSVHLARAARPPDLVTVASACRRACSPDLGALVPS
jgi:hypothetical protein